MSSDQHEQALRPVETAPGVLVHPTADRRLAVAHWLLSTLPAQGRDRARLEWRHQGLAMLPLGTLFSAIRIPGRLVMAITGTLVPHEIDGFLAEALDGGPVICDPRGPRYYALVPASVPSTWRDAADDWRDADVDVLGRGTLLGVPPVDAVGLDAATHASYWSVPMESMGMLCAPLKVARLIAAGHGALEEAEMAQASLGLGLRPIRES
ncbi:hypothetical protein [Streptomyces sp. NBC_01614]|uniref:hypothetical protein n=1 Tax=Streptomyces sp. NBC_01614 TaxID=2975897 RepID=UPI0038700F65